MQSLHPQLLHQPRSQNGFYQAGIGRIGVSTHLGSGKTPTESGDRYPNELDIIHPHSESYRKTFFKESTIKEAFFMKVVIVGENNKARLNKALEAALYIVGYTFSFFITSKMFKSFKTENQPLNYFI